MTLQIVEPWVSIRYERAAGLLEEGRGKMRIETDPCFILQLLVSKILISVIKHVGTALSSFVVTRKNYML